MFIYPIVVTSWMVAASIATPPPTSSIIHTEDDKDAARYLYKYIIGNGNVDEQGKIETRNGELAIGRYYINGEDSSTNVKYFADELGYHPLVKYGASTDHSEANAQFTLGGYTAKALVNEANFANEGEIIQSSSSNSQVADKNSHETVNNMEKLNAEESIATADETHGINNNLSTSSFETTLIIENSGNFGQRISQNHEIQSTLPILPKSYSSTTQPSSSVYYSPVLVHHDASIIVPKIRGENLTQNIESPVNNDTASVLVRIHEHLNSRINDEINYGKQANSQVLNQEFTSISSLHDKSNSSLESVDNFPLELLEKSTTSVAPPQVSPKFTKPIVVAEVPNYEHYEYSTNFPCNNVDNENVGSVTLSTTNDNENIPSGITTHSTLSRDTAVPLIPKLHTLSRITTSSVILNPIQAGVGLLNSGETSLINGENIQSLISNDNPEFVNSKKSILSRDIIENDGKNIVEFNNTYGLKNTGPSIDQTVEIQKSHEIYHNSPVQEIHYPAELMSHVVTINQVSPEYLNIKDYVNTRDIELKKTHKNIRNGNLEYQSIIDRPELVLQEELQTSPVGSRLLYHLESYKKKNNTNNLENSVKPIENYVTQENIQDINATEKSTTGEINFSTNSHIKQDTVYSQFKLVEKFMQNTGLNKIQQNEKKITSIVMGLRNNNSKHHVQSSLRELLAEEKQENEYASDSHIITSTVLPDKIEIKEISSEIEKPLVQYTLSQDLGKNTIYIHGQGMQRLPGDIGNYVGQNIHVPQNPLDTDISNIQKLQELNYPNMQYDTSNIYKINDNNKIIDKPVSGVHEPYTLEKKIIETKVPYPIQKIQSHLHPIHILEPQKIANKNHAKQEYQIELPIKQSNPLEPTVYNDNLINIPYGVQYGVSYQQIMNPQSHNVYENNPIDQQIQTNVSNQEYQGYDYIKPLIPFTNSQYELSKRYGSLNQLLNSKHFQQLPQQSSHLIYSKKNQFINQLASPLQARSIDHQVPLHRNVMHRALDKIANRNHEYIGPVPLPQYALNLYQQNQVVNPVHQETLRYLATVGRSNSAGTNLRRTRLPEMHYHSRTSNFRQSKMEYGFKPPMVPSVQYDEQTATRVEN